MLGKLKKRPKKSVYLPGGPSKLPAFHITIQHSMNGGGWWHIFKDHHLPTKIYQSCFKIQPLKCL